MKETVSQSLAGRTSLLTLFPPSIEELGDSQRALSTDELIWRGFMPELHVTDADPYDLPITSLFTNLNCSQLPSLPQMQICDLSFVNNHHSCPHLHSRAKRGRQSVLSAVAKGRCGSAMPPTTIGEQLRLLRQNHTHAYTRRATFYRRGAETPTAGKVASLTLRLMFHAIQPRLMPSFTFIFYRRCGGTWIAVGMEATTAFPVTWG